jgi:nucleoside-diphosphate-sugar epimerase
MEKHHIFVAGGSGTIGVPLVRTLVAAGHRVTALTRSQGKQAGLRALGAEVAVADALDRDALIAAVRNTCPTHVIHELTALPKDAPRRASDLDATNRLRVDGTRNLLDAAMAAGAGRFLVGSFAPLAPRGPASAEGEEPAVAAIRSMESQVLEASARGSIQGVILRYGLFYGAEAPSTVAMIDLVRKRRLPIVRHDDSQLPVIHLDDAVSATVAALDAAPAAALYEIVADRAVSMTEIALAIAEYTGSAAPLRVPGWVPRLIAPYMARMTSMRLPLSNAKARTELGWAPAYPTMREGLSRMLTHAA